MRGSARMFLPALAMAHAMAFAAPSEADIPAGPLGDSIRYGAKLLKQTQLYAKPYVGNGLNCTSCHLNGGTTPYAAPWVGLWGACFRSGAAATRR